MKFKSLTYFLLFAFFATSLFAQTMPTLDDYIGVWEVKEETYGCKPITITKGVEEGVVNITRNYPGIKDIVVSPSSDFTTSPRNEVFDYENFKISTSSLFKFIRGRIVSAHIWAPNENAFLGVGLRTFSLNSEGDLVKKKSGLTMQRESDYDPRENAATVFDFDNRNDDVLIRWEIECEYTKSS